MRNRRTEWNGKTKKRDEDIALRDMNTNKEILQGNEWGNKRKRKEERVFCFGHERLRDSQKEGRAGLPEGENQEGWKRDVLSGHATLAWEEGVIYTALIELGKGLLWVLTRVPRPHWEGGKAVVIAPPASISTSTLTSEKPASCRILVTCGCSK